MPAMMSTTTSTKAGAAKAGAAETTHIHIGQVVQHFVRLLLGDDAIGQCLVDGRFKVGAHRVVEGVIIHVPSHSFVRLHLVSLFLGDVARFDQQRQARGEGFCLGGL